MKLEYVEDYSMAIAYTMNGSYSIIFADENAIPMETVFFKNFYSMFKKWLSCHDQIIDNRHFTDSELKKLFRVSNRILNWDDFK